MLLPRHERPGKPQSRCPEGKVVADDHPGGQRLPGHTGTEHLDSLFGGQAKRRHRPGRKGNLCTGTGRLGDERAGRHRLVPRRRQPDNDRLDMFLVDRETQPRFPESRREGLSAGIIWKGPGSRNLRLSPAAPHRPSVRVRGPFAPEEELITVGTAVKDNHFCTSNCRSCSASRRRAFYGPAVACQTEFPQASTSADPSWRPFSCPFAAPAIRGTGPRGHGGLNPGHRSAALAGSTSRRLLGDPLPQTEVPTERRVASAGIARRITSHRPPTTGEVSAGRTASLPTSAQQAGRRQGAG